MSLPFRDKNERRTAYPSMPTQVRPRPSSIRLHETIITRPKHGTSISMIRDKPRLPLISPLLTTCHRFPSTQPMMTALRPFPSERALAFHPSDSGLAPSTATTLSVLTPAARLRTHPKSPSTLAAHPQFKMPPMYCRGMPTNMQVRRTLRNEAHSEDTLLLTIFDQLCRDDKLRPLPSAQHHHVHMATQAFGTASRARACARMGQRHPLAATGASANSASCEQSIEGHHGARRAAPLPSQHPTSRAAPPRRRRVSSSGKLNGCRKILVRGRPMRRQRALVFREEFENGQPRAQ